MLLKQGPKVKSDATKRFVVPVILTLTLGSIIRDTQYSLVWMLGVKYQSTPSRDGTCMSKNCVSMSRLLKQSRDGAAPTQNDLYHRILI